MKYRLPSLPHFYVPQCEFNINAVPQRLVVFDVFNHVCNTINTHVVSFSFSSIISVNSFTKTYDLLSYKYKVITVFIKI